MVHEFIIGVHEAKFWTCCNVIKRHIIAVLDSRFARLKNRTINEPKVVVCAASPQ